MRGGALSQLDTQALHYYALPGPVTDPGEHAGSLESLPSALPELCGVVQGLLIHVLEAQRYGVTLPMVRKQDLQIGQVAGILARVLELDPRPLAVARPPEGRIVATCHDFATLLCAMLQRQGRPARARSGFATYLVPGRYIDHWVCEVWSPQQARWLLVDAQLDDVLRRAYRVPFDPCDVPPEQFWTAGRAWQTCRASQADPADFGFARWWGMGYLRHSLLRDLWALNKIELLPWRSTGLPERDEPDMTEAERAELDRIAALTLAGDCALPELQVAYEQTVRLGSPPDAPLWQPDQV